MKLLSFDQALKASQGGGKRHLLLGNGFSIALKPKIFTYTALFDQAKKKGLLTEEVAALFAALMTTDFEVVIKALRDAAIVSEVYLHDAKTKRELPAKLRKDADAVREVLAKTISDSHPERPHDVTPEQYAYCRRFLSHFDDIYTLNYDLLLYWTSMQDLEPDILHDDGFRTPDDGPTDYVTWDIEKTNNQNIHYLHWALHIFDAGIELQKYTWCNTRVALIEQIREALAANKFPLIVAEGRSDEKLERIVHSNYLSRSFRSFSAIGGSLFIYGHSLADNDEHILRLIEKNKVSVLYVGVYGDPNSDSNKRIIKRAKEFPTTRPPKRPLKVEFFDSTTARVWDGKK